jgi:hypothetical protein
MRADHQGLELYKAVEGSWLACRCLFCKELGPGHGCHRKAGKKLIENLLAHVRFSRYERARHGLCLAHVERMVG